MPHFNEFRMNKELLGEVIFAKKKLNFSNDTEEDEEVRQFLNDLEDEKRENNKSIILRVMEKVTGKNLVQFKNDVGKKSIREYNPNNEHSRPQIRLSHTISPTIDFADDVNAWREYIHEEHIRDEQRMIEKDNQEKSRKFLVEIYSGSIQREMMKIN